MAKKRFDDNRLSASARGYGHKWRVAREAFLRNNPLCVMCAKHGRTRLAAVVDHVVPHKGDLKLFWDRDNWQALCKACHDSAKQAEERTGRVRGCGADGLPLDGRRGWGGGVNPLSSKLMDRLCRFLRVAAKL